MEDAVVNPLVKQLQKLTATKTRLIERRVKIGEELQKVDEDIRKVAGQLTAATQESGA